MKIVYYESRLAKLLLRGGYPTIMLFGFVLTKRPALDERSLRHEEIHAVPMAGVLLRGGGGDAAAVVGRWFFVVAGAAAVVVVLRVVCHGVDGAFCGLLF